MRRAGVPYLNSPPQAVPATLKMLMRKNTDVLITGGAAEKGIRFAYADVTDSASDLSRNHLAGPAASLVLGDALAAVAILAGDLTGPEETATLHIRTAAPIESILVESSFEGRLRGFTGKKLLPVFDNAEKEIDRKALYQGEASAMITFSAPGRIIGQSNLQQYSLTPAEAVKIYYRLAAQRVVEVVSRTEPRIAEFGVYLANAMLVELMPDGDQKLFDKLSRDMKSEAFQETLANVNDPVEILRTLGFDEEEISLDTTHPLAFACHCSRDLVKRSLLTLSKDELTTMSQRDKGTDIYCHMCGKCHTITQAELAELAAQRS